MQDVGMRPRFQIVLEHMEPKMVFEHVQKDVKCISSECMAVFRQPHMELMFKPEYRHYWSPRLSLEFEGQEQKTVIRGLIGPHPNVWTMFMALYGVCVLLSFVGAMLAYSQWSLGQSPWGMYGVMGACGGAMLLYMASLLGQRMALEQTIRLRRALEESLASLPEKLRTKS